MNELQTPVFVEAPARWEAVDLDGAVLAVAGPLEVDNAYRPNVVVTITPCEGRVPFERVVVSARHRLDELPDYVNVGQEAVTVFDGPGYRFEGSYRHPTLGTVFQALTVTVVPRDTVTDVVELTGTCAAADGLDMIPVIREIIASARHTEPKDQDAQ